MKAVEMTDINQVINEHIEGLKRDPVRKNNAYATHLADFCIEILEIVRNDISRRSKDYSRRY